MNQTNILLEISKELEVIVTVFYIIINDRIQEEYGDEIKTTILPYYKIKDIVYNKFLLDKEEIKLIDDYIINYWLDIEDSIN